jgi:hypothetical protein
MPSKSPNEICEVTCVNFYINYCDKSKIWYRYFRNERKRSVANNDWIKTRVEIYIHVLLNVASKYVLCNITQLIGLNINCCKNIYTNTKPQQRI